MTMTKVLFSDRGELTVDNRKKKIHQIRNVVICKFICNSDLHHWITVLINRYGHIPRISIRLK